MGYAQTGTGKTAAFGLPVIEKIDESKKYPQAIVLAPTRELAIQVAEEMNTLKGKKLLKIIPIYGGQSISDQSRKLSAGVHVVVGTPGRVIDHLKRGRLKIDKISHFILDEADEMLNMGFVEDIELILESAPKDKRMLLFSATMPDRIKSLAKKYMPNFKSIKVKKTDLSKSSIDQIYFEVKERDKFEALCRIIDIEVDFYGFIFCRTKMDVDRITASLSNRGYDVEGVHGDVAQNQRENTFSRFKKKTTRILVATDVAARGIDVKDISHVINYSLPQEAESYVHRVGRTGRAGKEGTAITFVTPSEYRKLVYIQRSTKLDIKKKNLPDVKEIISVKKSRVMKEIHEVIDSKMSKNFEEFAAELIAEYDPSEVVSALLKHFYKDELDAQSYKNLKAQPRTDSRDGSGRSRDRGGRGPVDEDGTCRLFIAKGKRDRMNKASVVEMITSKTRVKGSSIDGVEVLDNFSFVTVPFEVAEDIIRTFKKEGRGGKPMITKAKIRR
jgi:ATP-dependent RNA helicase DeaD